MKALIDINNSIPGADAIAAGLRDHGPDPDNRVIYRGRNTVAVTAGDEPLCVKSFGIPGFIKGLIYGLLRTPKAKRAYDNAVRLRSLGFDTPEPVAAVCMISGGRLGASYYVCRYLEGWSDLRGAENRPDFEALAHHLALLMNRLHNAGVLMKDFTQGNVLFRPDGNGGYSFALIDINRMEFDVHDRRRLMANFGAVLDTAGGLAVLAREYAALCPDPAAVERETNEIYRRRQARLWRKRHIKEFLRVCLLLPL